MPAGWAAAAAAVVGAAGQAYSANKSAKAQQKSTDAAIGEQQRQYDLAREDQAPYRQAGANALAQLTGRYTDQVQKTFENFDPDAYLRNNPDVAADPYFRGHAYDHYLQYGQGEGRQYTDNANARQQLEEAKRLEAQNPGGLMNRAITAEDVMQDPGYQFGLQQGQQALDRKIAAMGGRVSGAALKAAARYGTDYASTGYNAAYQRGQDRLNRLAAIAGIGQTATQASAASGANSANAISNLISSQGNANAAATMANGNIWGNAANQLGGYYMNQQRKTAQPYGLGYNPGHGYGAGYSGNYVNQGTSGGDVNGSYWGVE